MSDSRILLPWAREELYLGTNLVEYEHLCIYLLKYKIRKKIN